MGKLVVLNLLEGNFKGGFPAILEIGEDGARPAIALRGLLPSAPHIPESFRKWQAAFRDKVNPSPNEQSANRSRITPRRVTQFSCDESAKELAAQLNAWLNFGNGEWRQIRDGLRENLSRDDEIRVIIQTKDIQLRRLPWQVWDLFADRYTNAEIALSEPDYESPSGMPPIQRQSNVRILALLGRRDNINIQFDQQVLNDLRDRGAEIEILDQPERYKLIEKLWDSQGWHIFFFAGHSSSQEDGQIGWIDINQNDSLEIDEFKKSLRNAIKRGLQLAIFNSCDGLGLANQLSKLHLPQSIVMREPVPDQVAQEFLQHFLAAFANKKSFYVSVREARERLEGWEKQYASVSWLPVICQNPAVEPLTWEGFLPKPEVGVPPSWVLKYTLTGHSDTVVSVVISPDGTTLASGSLDHTIKLWNLATGELLSTLTGHSSVVLSLAFSPDGKILASGSNMEFQDGNIKLWDVDTARLQQTLGGSLLALRVSCIAFSPDGQTLASGHIDTTIRLWHLGSGKVRRTLRGHGWDVRSVAFSPDGQFLVSGGIDGAIKIWNWRTGELLHTLNRPSPSDLIGSLVSWFDSSIGSLWSVAISPDGQTLASGGSDQPIMLWNSSTGKLLRTLTEHSGTVLSVAFSPDGQTLVSGGDDNTIRIWNFQTGELLHTLRHLGPVKSVAFSPDGQTLVSGSADMTVKIWRLSS
ncbi:CHAT domain-containing protein [Microcoleus sp. FACHB-SPT15]|uniref:WD40 domain-containing protein n=1 Tax=Microcoleus sp. FACHB-SPT15 TaxID=2692830 RepID=UPI00177B26FF|nr:CHAT domain-containing protein [Microcoleus sp. FACHB-SPT15]MBD1803884.1 CHAT domain-containing protein [Microcoleus sp. FACHB-SPT15]